MDNSAAVITAGVEQRIFLIRGIRVMLDSDLAALYGVPTRVLNQAVKRNPERFPNDFMFQLDNQEVELLRSQIVTASANAEGIRSQFVTASRRNVRYLPYVFTEHGAIMAASVLNSKQAVEVSIFVVRAFIKLRELLAGNQELAVKFAELETRVDQHDETIRSLVAAIRQLMQPPEPTDKKQIGFKVA